MKPLISILILTNHGRDNYLNILLFSIAVQMKRYGLKDKTDIEILISKDGAGQHPDGTKMNALRLKAKGMWSFFMNDTDTLSDDYLAHAVQILKLKNPDCLNLIGNKSVNGLHNQPFINSIENKQMNIKDGFIFNPPNHFNMVRTEIAKKHMFLNQVGDVTNEWAERVAKSGELKTEARIEKQSYFNNVIISQN